jgi:hypothetical protein
MKALNYTNLEILQASGYNGDAKIKENINLGCVPSDIVEFLKNPLNEDVLKDLNNRIEKLWNT